MRVQCLRAWIWLLPAAFIGSAFCAVAAHATTELKAQWINPEIEVAPLQDVVVMALTRYPGLQRIVEDEVVLHFRAHGVAALPSYRSAQQDEQPADANAARHTIVRSGASVVLAIRMVNPKQADTAINPDGNGFYDWIDSRTVAPSGYREFTSEARLFDVTRSRWIWIGTFKTRNAGRDAAKTSQECTEGLVKVLESHKLLKPRS